jgi:hypothetical protein
VLGPQVEHPQPREEAAAAAGLATRRRDCRHTPYHPRLHNGDRSGTTTAAIKLATTVSSVAEIPAVSAAEEACVVAPSARPTPRADHAANSRWPRTIMRAQTRGARHAYNLFDEMHWANSCLRSQQALSTGETHVESMDLNDIA